MLTGDIRNQVDAIWNSFWTGGISNPLEVIEQITYHLFIRRLDELQTVEERKANRTGRPLERRIFPEGDAPHSRPYEDSRWARIRELAAPEMFTVLGEQALPFLRTLGTYAHHMRDASFTIPPPCPPASCVMLEARKAYGWLQTIAVLNEAPPNEDRWEPGGGEPPRLSCAIVDRSPEQKPTNSKVPPTHHQSSVRHLHKDTEPGSYLEEPA